MDRSNHPRRRHRLWKSRLPWVLAMTGLAAGSIMLLAGGVAQAARDAARAGMHAAPDTEGVHLADERGLDAVTKSLMCMCGCNLTVTACEGSMTCSIAARMKEEARLLLLEGTSQDAVMASFVADYGEQVLAAPTKEGFNLTAWVAPFAALAAGAGTVLAALVRWHRRRPAPVAAPPATPADDALMAELEAQIWRDE